MVGQKRTFGLQENGLHFLRNLQFLLQHSLWRAYILPKMLNKMCPIFSFLLKISQQELSFFLHEEEEDKIYTEKRHFSR